MMRCEKRKPPAAVMLTPWRPGMTAHSRRLRWRTATQAPPRLMRKVLHILEPSMGIVRPGWTMRFILFTPDYSYDERARRHRGTGLFRLILDLKTGAVTNVTVIT